MAAARSLAGRVSLKSQNAGGMKEQVTMILRVFAAFIIALALAAPASAAQCGGNFNTFLAEMAREAQAAGISPAVVAQAFAGLTPDQRVLRLRPPPGACLPPRGQLRGLHQDARRLGPRQARRPVDAAPRRACSPASSGNTACRRNCWWRSGPWRATTEPATSASCRSSARRRRSPGTAAAPSCSSAS